MVKPKLSRKIKALTTRYLTLLYKKRIAEAQRILEKINLAIKQSSWHKGYCNALEGMVLAFKSRDDQYLYLNRIYQKDQKGLKKLQKEFSKQSKNFLQDDFDKGYFTAWLVYIKLLQAYKKASESLNDTISNLM